MSGDLTRSLNERVTSDKFRYPDEVKALDAALAAINAYDQSRGIESSEIDIERLFSAVQMLGNLDDVELTPFVNSWLPALQQLDLSPAAVVEFHRRLGQTPDKWSTYESTAAVSGGQTATSGHSWTIVYRMLEKRMLMSLRLFLMAPHDKLGYLSPLLNLIGTSSQLVTLNYDLSIELMAEQRGVDVDTGMDGWSGGQWSWSNPNALRLLKLHGSIDWWRHVKSPSSDKLKEIEYSVDKMHRPDEHAVGPDPGIIFGRLGKMRNEGPYLSMLSEFDRALSRSEELIVIGYSFRDEHINDSLRRWFNRVGPKRKVTIVDPKLEPLVDGPAEPRSRFLNELVVAMTEKDSTTRMIQPRPGNTFLREKASSALPVLFGLGP
jgi:hypothetical protein